MQSVVLVALRTPLAKSKLQPVPPITLKVTAPVPEPPVVPKINLTEEDESRSCPVTFKVS